MFDLFST